MTATSETCTLDLIFLDPPILSATPYASSPLPLLNMIRTAIFVPSLEHKIIHNFTKVNDKKFLHNTRPVVGTANRNVSFGNRQSATSKVPLEQLVEVNDNC